MTAPTVSFTEANVFTVVRTLLLKMLPAGTEVIRAQINRVPEPAIPDFVVMTQIMRQRLSSSVDTFADGYPDTPGFKSVVQSDQLRIQLDVHGPASGDNVAVLQALMRDDYATTYFDGCGFDIQFLDLGDPHQVPFINAESQWENRWTIDLDLQVGQVVQLQQDFAGALKAGINNVDVVYPP